MSYDIVLTAANEKRFFVKLRVLNKNQRNIIT